MTKFEEQFLYLLQQEIDDKKIVPLDFDLIYRMKTIQEKANEAELRSVMKEVAAKFGYEVDHFEDNEFMCSKWVSAKIDIGDDKGEILADMDWHLAEVIAAEEYYHLCKWDKHGSFDALEWE